ncbi:MAG: hypothetical protein E7553_06645 [Ruminococcaceae bacterium]|nr:hypothetical protein [Oscillospiraceae bacterium]
MSKLKQWLAGLVNKYMLKHENNTPVSRDDGAQERARQAYYMRNFWNYDGSEQQEWDEQGQ